jgi:hypothetical protein
VKPSLFAVFLFLSSGLTPAILAQATGGFGGPSVLSSGLGSIGKRSGQDVDLRLFGNVQGVYDTGLAPFDVNSNGTLLQPEGQYGLEAGLGAYGRHQFRRSLFGLDYQGNVRYYPNVSNSNSSNHRLGVEYAYQKSRRLLFDLRADASRETFGTTFGPGAGGNYDSTALLFDNRTDYLNGGMTVNYALSNRTVISMGGSAYTVRRKAQALIGVNGYNFTGSIRHQMGRDDVVGVTYGHTHYDYPRAFGETEIEMYTGNWTHKFGRTWTFTIAGGIFTSAAKGVQSTTLAPALAALLGVGSIPTAFYKENLYPTGQISLSKQFRRSSFSLNYSRTTNPGNGVYLASRQESFDGSYSYTGFRRASFSIGAGTSNLDSLGQTLQTYRQTNAIAQFTYRLGGGLNLSAGYARRYQDITANVYQRSSSRTSFGIYFSPGDIPISFH